MKKIMLAFSIIIVLNFITPLYVYKVFANNREVDIVYFYINPCAACNETENYLDNFEEIMGQELKDIEINYKLYNTFHINSYNLLQRYYEVYNVPKADQLVPIIFIGDTFLQGEQNIKAKLKDEVLKGKSMLEVGPSEEGPNKALELFSKMDAYNVLLAGVINGFNPCSISMLLFFISTLMVRQINIFKTGVSFCTGKFITYLLLGTLLFYVMTQLEIGWYKPVIKIIMIIFILTIIILNIWDYNAARRERYDKVMVQLPSALRKMNHYVVKQLSNILNRKNMIFVSFILGALVSIGEFFCTGQVYLATILYVKNTQTVLNMRAFAYFIVYSLAAILPLLLITIMIHKGKEIFDVSEVIRAKMPLIKLFNAVIFILFGAWIVFFF